jgi:hypothetical protein
METIKRLEAIKQELIKANSAKNSQQATALWKEMQGLLLATLFAITKIKVNNFKIEDITAIKNHIIAKYKYNIADVDLFFSFLEDYFKYNVTNFNLTEKSDFGITFCINWLKCYESLYAENIKPTFLKVSKDEKGFTQVEKLAIDIANILPNEILTSSLFDLENIRSIHNAGIAFLNVESKEEQKQRILKETNLKDKFENFNFKLPEK